MPRTKFDRPKYPPIERLRACILDRKMSLKLTWADIGKNTHISPDYLRKIITTVPTDQWNPAIRNAVCKELGIRVKTDVVDLFNLDGDGR